MRKKRGIGEGKLDQSSTKNLEEKSKITRKYREEDNNDRGTEAEGKCAITEVREKERRKV